MEISTLGTTLIEHIRPYLPNVYEMQCIMLKKDVQKAYL